MTESNDKTTDDLPTMEEAEKTILSLTDDVYFRMLPLPFTFLEKYKDSNDVIKDMYEEKIAEDKHAKRVMQEMQQQKDKAVIQEALEERSSDKFDW